MIRILACPQITPKCKARAATTLGFLFDKRIGSCFRGFECKQQGLEVRIRVNNPSPATVIEVARSLPIAASSSPIEADIAWMLRSLGQNNRSHKR
jgi:hypothetical protein